MKKLVLPPVLILLPIALGGCATTHHVSKSERASRAATLFDRLDVNHDGYLTRAELSSGLRYAGAPEINPNLVLGLKPGGSKKAKASRKLTEAEIQKAMKEAFEERDADLDRRLSKDEFKKLVVERPPGENDDPWEPFM